MPKTKIALRILGVIVAALLAWVAFTPRHGRPNIAVKLLGYTNDSSGTRLAMIAVTNLSEFTAFVYLPIIQIQAPTERGGFTNYFEGNTNQWQRFHSKLGEGESGSFTIPPPPPTYHTPWRLSFYAYTDYGTVQVIKNIIAGRRHPFQIESDWIEKDK